MQKAREHHEKGVRHQQGGELEDGPDRRQDGHGSAAAAAREHREGDAGHRDHERQHVGQDQAYGHRPEGARPVGLGELDGARERCPGAAALEEADGVDEVEGREKVDERREEREGAQARDKERGDGEHQQPQHHPDHAQEGQQRRPRLVPQVGALERVELAAAVGEHDAERRRERQQRRQHIGRARHHHHRPQRGEHLVRIPRERPRRVEQLHPAEEQQRRRHEHERRPGHEELPDEERPQVGGQKPERDVDDVAKVAGPEKPDGAAVGVRLEVGRHGEKATARSLAVPARPRRGLRRAPARRATAARPRRRPERRTRRR